jgi:hypothetical protein
METVEKLNKKGYNKYKENIYTTFIINITKMLKQNEIEIMKQNAVVHKKIFDEIKKVLKDGTTAKEINKLC